MRIASVEVSSYRCLKSLHVDLLDYTALVGTNGSGKSAILYALNWFFNGGQLDEEDVCKLGLEEGDSDIWVEVTFDDLTARDKAVLGSYATGETAVFRRSWSASSGEKMIGNALQGPEFTAVRQAAGASATKQAYMALRAQLPELPAASTMKAILEALTTWELDPSNRDRLVRVTNADANHLFGFNGEATLASLMRLVLVPAASDLASELGQTQRGSALGSLIGALMSDAVRAARETWEAEHAGALEALETAIRTGVARATDNHAARVSAHLSQLVPNAGVAFTAYPPSWSLRGDASIVTTVKIDGAGNDVGRQGHGVQRAVMIAMLQAIVMDSVDAVTDDRDREGAPQGPALIVCVEEPEIYQHPVRARSFARVLTELSRRERTQVLIATHSPYFVRPEQFDSLRRLSLSGGCSSMTQATVQEVAQAAAVAADKVKKLALQELPRTLSEGFFADAVVFVEGDTDRVIIEALAEKAGTPLDAVGIVVIPMGGKAKLRVPTAMLTALGVPSYIIADSDSGGSVRKYGDDPDKVEERAQAEASQRSSTEKLCAWLPDASTSTVVGSYPYNFGDPTLITSSYAIWHDDMEHELEQWPSFMAAVEAHGGRLRAKDALLYRNAVHEASLDDAPELLTSLVGVLHRLV